MKQTILKFGPISDPLPQSKVLPLYLSQFRNEFIELLCVLYIYYHNTGNEDDFEIEAMGFGETFDLQKHPQGTEVKAITYSAMQINENPNFAEVFVIIDI